MNYRSLNSYNKHLEIPQTCNTICSTQPAPSSGSQTSSNCTKTNGIWLHNDGSPLSQCICNGYGVCNQGDNTCSCNDDHMGTTCAPGFVSDGNTPPKCLPTPQLNCGPGGTPNIRRLVSM